MSENRSLTFFVGALITSALGGVLVFATDLGGFNGSNYYLGVYVWGGIGAFSGVYSILIILAGFLLIYCMIISVLVLKFPEKIPDKKFVRYGLYASIAAFILTIINGIIFAVIATDEDWWWWFDAGFYGGVIGGLLTAIFYYMGEKEVVLT
ncbi:hypothetical protein LCGC14_0590420 [marine sediment metagenome]|uniref:Uncharacterized protein n=1 Tax=marine sediment metagenome TaxID=412755 RepID=A0A0F9RIK1_9ZZZZ|nr:MAG: hypothetical protein Lokiarch_48900 [Candidatus Lokiarchaeum sp. GC14_75]HEA70726.1 hypothetical protein [archaeon]